MTTRCDDLATLVSALGALVCTGKRTDMVVKSSHIVAVSFRRRSSARATLIVRMYNVVRSPI